MKTNRKSKLLALFLSVCQMVTFFVFNASAFSSNGTEFNCGDTWVLEENVSAVNTGKSIDGVTAGIIVKVPEVNFYAGEYKAIAINAVSDNRDLNRVKVYLDGVQTDNLLAGIDFKTVGDDKTARYSAWGALEKSVSGVHDLYIYVAAGSFNLIGFKLGSETELEVSGTVIGQPEVDDTVSSTPVTDGTESSPPVIDGVVDESYETVLEMKDGSVYDLNGDTDKAVIKKYVTDEYVYLAVQYTRPGGSVGTTRVHNQIEIAIDPDPSNNGTNKDCRALSNNASRNEIYSYFNLTDPSVTFSNSQEHGTQHAYEVTTDAGGASIYTVEYRFNRPDSVDENFLIGCNVLVNNSKRYATHAPFDDGTSGCSWNARYIPGMYSVPYTMGETSGNVPQEPTVDGVVDASYETVLEMKDGSVYDLNGDTDKAVIKKYVTDEYVYLAVQYTKPDGPVGTTSAHNQIEIAIDPDPSNNGTSTDCRALSGDASRNEIYSYFKLSESVVDFSGGKDHGAQKACKVTTDAGASIYTVEYRFNRPDSADENFLLGCSVLVNASKRYATHASFDDGTTDCNWRARYIPGMYSVPYTMGETPSDVPQEPIVNAVLDPFYLEGDTDKNIYVKAGDNKYGYEVKTYMAADSADLYYFMVLTGQRHENVSNPKAEINFDPDPSNSEETGDNTKVGVGDSNDKDFRIYWNPVSGGSNYGFNANKGTKYAERTTYLENNMVEYAIEIKIPRPAEDTYQYAFDVHLDATTVISNCATKNNGSAKYENMVSFSYGDAVVDMAIPAYFETGYHATADWAMPEAVKDGAKMEGMHTGYVVKLAGIDFGTEGARYLAAKGKSVIDSSISIYIDDPAIESNKIGYALVPGGFFSEYGDKVQLNRLVTGTHDLYIVSGGGLFDLSAIKLSGKYPIYAVVDGVMDQGLYNEDHMIDASVDSKYAIDTNKLNLNQKFYYYVTDDYFYLYALTDMLSSVPLSAHEMQMFLDPNPYKNVEKHMVATLQSGDKQGENWFWTEFTSFKTPDDNGVKGALTTLVNGSTYRMNKWEEGDRSYYGIEMRFEREPDEDYFGLGFKIEANGTYLMSSVGEQADTSHYTRHIHIFYRDPIVVDGEKDESYTENNQIQLIPDSDYEVGENPNAISGDLFYEFDNDKVSFYVESRTKEAPAADAFMTLFADTNPYKNNAKYADMTAALEDLKQTESGFRMAFNGDTAERIGTALKNTELASKVSGPDENGVYTYSMEVSLPRENGENYFLVGCTVNDGDACVYNLARKADVPADSYEDATKVYYKYISPMSWQNLMGVQPSYQTQKAVNGSVEWSYPYEKQEEPSNPVSSEVQKPTASTSTTSTPSNDAPFEDTEAADELRQIVEDAVELSKTEGAENIVLKLSEDNCVLTDELLTLLKDAAKPVRIEVYAEEDEAKENILNFWEFSAIEETANSFDPHILNRDNGGLGGKSGVILDLAHKGALPGPAVFGFPHNGLFENGNVILTYVYNEESGKMEYTTALSPTITEDGFVTFNPESGGVFALLKHEETPDSNDGTQSDPAVNNNEGGSFPWWAVLLICAGGAIVLVGIFILVMILMSKRGKKEE